MTLVIRPTHGNVPAPSECPLQDEFWEDTGPSLWLVFSAGLCIGLVVGLVLATGSIRWGNVRRPRHDQQALKRQSIMYKIWKYVEPPHVTQTASLLCSWRASAGHSLQLKWVRFVIMACQHSWLVSTQAALTRQESSKPTSPSASPAKEKLRTAPGNSFQAIFWSNRRAPAVGVRPRPGGSAGACGTPRSHRSQSRRDPSMRGQQGHQSSYLLAEAIRLSARLSWTLDIDRRLVDSGYRSTPSF